MDIKAQTTANFIAQEIIFKFGVPKQLLTDHSSNFKANLIRELCKAIKIQKLNSSVYHQTVIHYNRIKPFKEFDFDHSFKKDENTNSPEPLSNKRNDNVNEAYNQINSVKCRIYLVI